MYDLAETLHRVVKLDIDAGRAKTVEEAHAQLTRYRVGVSISTEAARHPVHQATLLTFVNIGRRCLLGGVEVSGCLDVPLLCPVLSEPTLTDAVIRLGGAVAQTHAAELPRICIGPPQEKIVAPFAITTTFQGWRGGIAPVRSGFRLKEEWGVMPVGVLEASLAVNEAFAYLRGDQADAGLRTVGLSLWNPNEGADWTDAALDGPPVPILPTKIWVAGLGHLGQVYLWTLALLPYTDPSDVELMLQDVDRISPSTESTSILTECTMIGQMKTRAVAQWMEARGFRTFLQERLFDGSFHRQPHEPQVLLCGIDNALGRQCLEDVGFGFIVEAGLGRGVDDFRTIRLHTFPGRRRARDIWKAFPAQKSMNLAAPAYQALAKAGVGQCGLALLADKAVGAPFVGGVAASLVIAEVLRLLVGGPVYSVIDVDLRSLRHRMAVANLHDFSSMNPGFTASR